MSWKEKGVVKDQISEGPDKEGTNREEDSGVFDRGGQGMSCLFDFVLVWARVDHCEQNALLCVTLASLDLKWIRKECQLSVSYDTKKYN